MSNMTSCVHDPVDEVLELVWVLEEGGEEATADRMASQSRRDPIDAGLLGRVVSEGLLTHDGALYRFTAAGRERGENIIRRHRLAERLLVDILGVQMIAVEVNACCFEHVLSPEVTDRICTLLGHPRKCPHGASIPRGPCCRRAERRIETAVVPLTEVRPGESGRIVYISTPNHHRLDRLASLGLLPGRVLKVHQSEPLFVVLLDEMQLALERDIVAEIYVLRR